MALNLPTPTSQTPKCKSVWSGSGVSLSLSLHGSRFCGRSLVPYSLSFFWDKWSLRVVSALSWSLEVSDICSTCGLFYTKPSSLFHHRLLVLIRFGSMAHAELCRPAPAARRGCASLSSGEWNGKICPSRYAGAKLYPTKTACKIYNEPMKIPIRIIFSISTTDHTCRSPPCKQCVRARFLADVQLGVRRRLAVAMKRWFEWWAGPVLLCIRLGTFSSTEGLGLALWVLILSLAPGNPHMVV